MHTMRTIALILVAVALASLAVLAGLIAWLGPWWGLGVGLAIAVVVVGAYRVLVAPWQRRWGATDDEVAAPMPGDDLLRADAPSTTRAVTVRATPDQVFPWLLQIGFGRGGWYSYDRIDNDGRPSVERIDWALQHLAVGDRIEMMPGFGPVVKEIEPGRHIVSGGEADSWCVQVRPGPGGTRLISRWRQDWPKGFGTWAWATIADPGAFIMERKMLLRLRELAERVASTPQRA